MIGLATFYWLQIGQDVDSAWMSLAMFALMLYLVGGSYDRYYLYLSLFLLLVTFFTRPLVTLWVHEDEPIPWRAATKDVLDVVFWPKKVYDRNRNKKALEEAVAI